MTERERLIELLKDNCSCRNEGCAKCGCSDKCFTHREADYLLENGVIVPPCKVGDDIWYIDEKNNVRCEKGDIHKIVYSGNGKFEIMDRYGAIDEVGTNFAYLTKEAAEEALKGGAE